VPTSAILHFPFEQQLHHLRQASFCAKMANCNMFAEAAMADPSLPLSLDQKNFVHQTGLIELFSNVIEERGAPIHNHLMDRIIFQPNRLYLCGMDLNLLKCKYLDAVTIDFELIPLHLHDSNDLCVSITGYELACSVAKE
jgi:hypothetical protein